MDTGGGAEVDQAVATLHQLIVMLNNEEGVSFVAQGLKRLNEAIVVAGVKADGGLVEDVEHASEVGAELGGKADALGFAAAEGVGRTIETEVAEADVIEEAEALADLRDDVLHNGAAALVEGEAVEGRNKIGGSEGEEGGKGERGVLAAEVELYRTGDAGEALAVTVGARRACVSHVVLGIYAKGAEAGGGIIVVLGVFVGDEHPRENAAMAAAGGTPAARGVVREMLGIKLGKTFAGVGVGAGGGEPRKHGALLGEKEAGALAEFEGLIELVLVRGGLGE